MPRLRCPREDRLHPAARGTRLNLPSDPDDLLGADAEEIVRRVAGAIRARLPEITGGMRDTLAGAVAELVGDGRLVDLLAGAIDGNVATALSMLQRGTPLHEVEVPAAAVDHARRLAQQGVPVFAMVRAYRLGQAYLLQEGFAEIAGDLDGGASAAASLAAYNAINARTLAYIDWVSQEVVTVYETERDQWVRTQDAVRAERVREVLAGRGGDSADTADTEAVLRHRLRQHHLAAVAWSDVDAAAGGVGHLESALHAVGAELGGAADPLVVATDGSTSWAWFPRGDDGAEPDTGRLERALESAGRGAVRIAVGGVGHGADGFGASHRQALEAQRVLRAGGDRRLISYREAGVPAAAFLAGDPDRTRTLVRAALGPLADDDPATERLRATLLCFLECGSSYTAAAARLRLHKNSVKYRVERALDLRGRPLGDDRIDVELALVACRWLPGIGRDRQE